jgi:hypothetical protein
MPSTYEVAMPMQLKRGRGRVRPASEDSSACREINDDVETPQGWKIEVCPPSNFFLRPPLDIGALLLSLFPSLSLSEVSLAQLVGRIDVQTQHVSSNSHERKFRFLFILEDEELMQFVLRTRLHLYLRLNFLILILNG